MDNKLILVEGIPGSGKTTISAKIKEHLGGLGIKVRLFNEGDYHPADMAWNAYIPIEEYRELLKKYPQYEETIKKNTALEDDYALVAYTKLGLGPNEDAIMRYFDAHEIYDGRVSIDIFRALHLKRWKQFADSVKDDEVVIFECAFLQNHINELMGANDKAVDFIIDYMVELIATVKNLNPKLIYLTQENVRETIDRVAKERVSPDKNKWEDWIELVIKYVENSQYGKVHKLKGFDGTVCFFEERKKIELAVIEKLPIEKAIIYNRDYDWKAVVEQVIKNL